MDMKEKICEHVVCGINETHIQKRLLQEAKLTFQRAKERALVMELAKKKTSNATQSIQRFQTRAKQTAPLQHVTNVEGQITYKATTNSNQQRDTIVTLHFKCKIIL